MKIHLLCATLLLATLLGCSKTDDTPNPENPGEQMVDLGLSVKWAAWNIGAESPEEAGGYYAWGELSEKNDYSLDTYAYYNPDGYWDQNTLGPTILGGENDVAAVTWGDGWRMPAESELVELINKCKWQPSTYNDVPGIKVIGPNGNSIFFPAVGYKDGKELIDFGVGGAYWMGERMPGGNHAFYLSIKDGSPMWSITRSCYKGCTVRAVKR